MDSRAIKVKRLGINLDTLHMSKPLHPDTVSKILTESDAIIYRLYQLINEKKEMNYFAELNDSEGYSFSAYVKSKFTFTGEAKEQLNNINKRSGLIDKKPLYIVKCQLTDLYSNKSVFKYEHETTSRDIVFNSIETCLNELKLILNEKINATG